MYTTTNAISWIKIKCHFFINLDKLLYSFKKKKISGCLNFVGSKVHGTFEHILSHVYIRLILQFVAKAAKREAKV